MKDYWLCSLCGEKIKYRKNYVCPYCGTQIEIKNPGKLNFETIQKITIILE